MYKTIKEYPFSNSKGGDVNNIFIINKKLIKNFMNIIVKTKS